MKNRIWLSPPHMGRHELEYIRDVFKSNWIAPLGPAVDGFESDLVSYMSVRSAAALSTGTAAIHLSLILCGVESGDEVICSSFTFSATANPIVYQGGIPIFVDSEKSTWNMSPVHLEGAIKHRILTGKKPKAIILVHLYGVPAALHESIEIADRYEIPLIEDAAESLGSMYHGKKVGSFGAMGILSFNGNKIITTSGGGALISNNDELVRKARFLATQARDPAPHYEHSSIGYNYRMSNVCAAIGRGQMKVLSDRIARRREIHRIYRNALMQYEGVTFVDEPSNSFSNRWLTCIVVDPKKTGGLTREDIRLKLESHNIESRPLWKPMHLQPVFAGCPFYGDGVSEQLFRDGLCLPSGSSLSDSDLEKIIAALASLFRR
ncbi:pyridoxal phosphate-dependent aminotransferase [bacterium]|nr:MAG: pyridoxal phosphate-dependent aminotransferase [bacterium]